MKHCSNCGQQLSDEASFCGKCGAASNNTLTIDTANEPTPITEAGQSEGKSQLSLPVQSPQTSAIGKTELSRNSQSPANSKKIAGAILAIIVVIACFYVWRLSNANNPEAVARTVVENAINGKNDYSLFTNEEDAVVNIGVIRLALSMTEDRDFDYKITSRKGDTVVVEVNGSKESLCDIELVQKSGKWVVSYVPW